MRELKIAIIGSGSTYTPELIEGLIERRDSLPIRELYLMDIDEEKNQIVGNLSKRMLEHAAYDFPVFITDDLRASLDGADYVLAQVRVGRLPARVLDESIPIKYDLLGQETTGIGGFFKALRTIPVLGNVAKIMQEVCPNAWLINFSNPSGIIAEALLNHYNIKMMGLCNVPINMIDSVKKAVDKDNVEVQYFGLNHLSWITAILHEGQDLLPGALKEGVDGGTMANIPNTGFDQELLQSVGGIPSPYLQYFYYHADKVKHLQEEEQCRGQVCMEIEKNLLEQYKAIDLTTKPEELNKRGGHRYSEAAISLVDAIENDKQERHVVNVQNNGALPFLKDTDAVEVMCVIGKDGATPEKIEGYDNDHIISLMQAVKAYERYTVDAAINGDDVEAMSALMSHPLLNDYKSVKDCYDELKEAHKAYLPQFDRGE